MKIIYFDNVEEARIDIANLMLQAFDKMTTPIQVVVTDGQLTVVKTTKKEIEDELKQRYYEGTTKIDVVEVRSKTDSNLNDIILPIINHVDNRDEGLTIEELSYMEKIGVRAKNLMDCNCMEHVDLLTMKVDIALVHLQHGIDLRKLANAKDVILVSDIHEIRRSIDRRTGKVKPDLMITCNSDNLIKKETKDENKKRD